MVEQPAIDRVLARPPFSYYFRYRLRPSDFRPFYRRGQHLGDYAAKPLYGKLNRAGRVDRRAGLDGRLAVLFVPAGDGPARLLFTRMSPEWVLRPDGRRNWPAIRRAAEQALAREYPPLPPAG